MTLYLMVNRWVELVMEAVVLEVVVLEALALAEKGAHICNLKG